MDETDDRDDRAGDHHARGHQHDDLRAQGHGAGFFVACGHELFPGDGPLLPACHVESFLEGIGHDMQDDRNDPNGDALVHKVDQDVRRELSQELILHTAVEKALRKR